MLKQSQDHQLSASAQLSESPLAQVRWLDIGECGLLIIGIGGSSWWGYYEGIMYFNSEMPAIFENFHGVFCEF